MSAIPSQRFSLQTTSVTWIRFTVRRKLVAISFRFREIQRIRALQWGRRMKFHQFFARIGRVYSICVPYSASMRALVKIASSHAAERGDSSIV